MMQRAGWMIVAAMMAVGCADAGTEAGDKPESDPDVELLEVGKADALSNWYTTRMGELALGTDLKAEIDWPDWYHGYTLELTAGQTVALHVSATERGLVRLYGPSHRSVDGEPQFRRAAWRGHTAKDGGLWAAKLELEVEEDGTYMLVYGPSWWWYATYKMKAECVAGCLPDDACLSDDACAAGEFCGDNGVRCVTAPCTANYDVCQPQLGVDAYCDRDAMCASGLSCVDDACAAPVVDGSCTGWQDETSCADGFCGCVDGACSAFECKPWSYEGEGCGGFVMPQYVRRCTPELQCMGPQFIADLPGTCGTPATVAEILADPEAFDGVYVGLSGTVATGFAMCTKMACWPENPCCNSCGASQRLYDEAPETPDERTSLGLKGAEDGITWGCGGNECSYQDNCTVENGYYWIGGTVRVDTYDVTIEVSRQYKGWEMTP